MKVKCNFDTIYQTETDPWQTGDATAPRYDLYYDLIMKYAPSSHSGILDIGCGMGAFLNRFSRTFNRLHGIDVSKDAIIRGISKYPNIHFQCGSADFLYDTDLRWNIIVLSDVIYYLNEQGKNKCLKWIAEHLAKDGIALIAAWCSGKNYLLPDELRRLIQKYFNIQEETLLNTGHLVTICRKKRKLVAITVDYETWQPVPEGKEIDWSKDIFEPAYKIARFPKVTFFVDVVEYWWLKKNRPEIATAIEGQWRNLVKMGCDLQLHLHPAWLQVTCDSGVWQWGKISSNMNYYPYSLEELMLQGKVALGTITGKPITCFRAGGYAVQPSKRLYDALVAGGMKCDSSVYKGGVSKERQYNFSLAYSDHQPYFANPYDFQLKALPSERDLIELPIFTPIGQRWFIDNEESQKTYKRLVSYLNMTKPATSERYRHLKQVRGWLGLPHYQEEVIAGNDYYVMTGHTKADHNFTKLAADLKKIEELGFEFITLSDMVEIARDDLLTHAKSITPQEETTYQVKREYNAVMSKERNWQQSYHLQDMIPWDRDKVLDLGCGTGYWTARIAERHPWMKVIGVDISTEFIKSAKECYKSFAAQFEVGNFSSLPFADKSFYCIYADNSLEHAFDVDKVLKESYRVLADNGVLVAAIPSDARNPRAICDDHNWKTEPNEVRMRLKAVGFKSIEIDEVDVRKLGARRYPPSCNMMIFIRAWKGSRLTGLARALEIMDWVYHKLEPPDKCPDPNPVDYKKVLVSGKAWCLGYCVALEAILKQEGYKVRHYSIITHKHPRGRGKSLEDSHEVTELKLDNNIYTLDPTANIYFPYSVKALVANPLLADVSREIDKRYKERHYELYTTSFWYERVVKVIIPRRWLRR